MELENKRELKIKLEKIKELADEIDNIWYKKIEDKNREEIDNAFNTSVSYCVRWLLTNVEDMLEEELKEVK